MTTVEGSPKIFVVNPWIKKGNRSVKAKGIYQLSPEGNYLPTDIDPDNRMFENACTVYARYFTDSNEKPRKGFIVRISEGNEGNIGSRRFSIISADDWEFYPMTPDGYQRVAQESAELIGNPDLTILIA